MAYAYSISSLLPSQQYADTFNQLEDIRQVTEGDFRRRAREEMRQHELERLNRDREVITRKLETMTKSNVRLRVPGPGKVNILVSDPNSEDMCRDYYMYEETIKRHSPVLKAHLEGLLDGNKNKNNTTIEITCDFIVMELIFELMIDRYETRIDAVTEVKYDHFGLYSDIFKSNFFMDLLHVCNKYEMAKVLCMIEDILMERAVPLSRECAKFHDEFGLLDRYVKWWLDHEVDENYSTMLSQENIRFLHSRTGTYNMPHPQARQLIDQTEDNDDEKNRVQPTEDEIMIAKSKYYLGNNYEGYEEMFPRATLMDLKKSDIAYIVKQLYKKRVVIKQAN